MNWYDLLKVSQGTPPVGQVDSGGNLFEDLEDANNCQDVQRILSQYGASFSIVKWTGGADPVYVLNHGDTFVIECDNGVSTSRATDWVYDLNSFDLDSYVPMQDYNENFWSSVGSGQILYHATDSSNIESILQDGLLICNKTRGVSNRCTGSAVFTSSNVHAIDSYGDAVIQIHVDRMKADGYMPRVSAEEPLADAEQRQSIAWKLGLRDFFMETESGIGDETVIFFDNIPAKYLSVIS